MVYLDAHALISFLRGERGPGEAVRDILDDREAAVTAINLAEVYDVLARRFSVPADRTRSALAPILSERLAIHSVDPSMAERAGELRARWHHRKQRPLSLADCVLIAAPPTEEDAVASADAAVLEAAEGEGVATVTLRAPR